MDEDVDVAAMMCYIDTVSNHPDLLWQELKEATEKYRAPFPEHTNAICTREDTFLLDCYIKGVHCDKKNDKDPKKLPYATQAF